VTTTAFGIHATGTLNGRGFVADGDGLAEPTAGRIDFGVTFETNLDGTSPFGALLSILIIPTTGFGRSLEGSTNLVDLTGEGFDFTQDVAGDRVALHATGSFRRAPDASRFNWSSEASGRVALGDVVGVDPFTAVMVPGGPGSMVETIEIPVKTADARTVVTIVRRFRFNDRLELPHLQLRHMTLALDNGHADRAAAVRIQADIYPFRREPGTAPRVDPRELKPLSHLA
jgi:hypothetical protein